MSKKPLCILNPGHQENFPGASNQKTGMSEYQFNSRLATVIFNLLFDSGIEVKIINQTDLHDLPDDINRLHPDFVISLHCNGSEQPATGTEVLYHTKSEKGKKMAGILEEKVTGALGLRNRGIKELKRGDRGFFLVDRVDAPTVICEPYYITNDNDLHVATEKFQELAGAYVAAIREITKLFGENRCEYYKNKKCSYFSDLVSSQGKLQDCTFTKGNPDDCPKVAIGRLVAVK